MKSRTLENWETQAIIEALEKLAKQNEGKTASMMLNVMHAPQYLRTLAADIGESDSITLFVEEPIKREVEENGSK